MISGMIGWGSVRPVNRLMKMPEPGGVDAGVGGSDQRSELKRDTKPEQATAS